MLAITAWNLALSDENEIDHQIDSLLRTLDLKKDSGEWLTMADTLTYLIDKKILEYPFINRFIIDFEFIQMGDGFHLNIISSIPS